MTLIRPETATDIPAVWQVNEQAFGRAGEADLVDALRGRGAATTSLVAVEAGAVVGHILFSPVTVGPEAPGQAPAVGEALGPMAVLPARQKQGIGSQLVRAGLDDCRRRGAGFVAVLGDPKYYGRFGFTCSAPYSIRCTWDVPPEYFMVIELQPGTLAGVRGLLKYQPEFDAVT